MAMPPYSPLADSVPTQERILVIYTGGTIGMQQHAEGLAPGGDFTTRMATALNQLPLAQQQLLPPYQVISYATLIDSSAATPLTWQQLARDINDQLTAYAGFVIIHGTDTLSWTAASLAYQLQGLDRPVVVTGSMSPLESPGSDALDNLHGALQFAAKPELQEVAIYFAGQLLRGVRAIKQHSEAANAFASPNYPLLGERVGDDFVYYPSRGLGLQQRGAPRFELPDYRLVNQGEIVRIALWPGISAWQLDAWLSDSRVKGALLQLWGAGNLPGDPSVLDVLARVRGEGKLLAAISQCPQGSVHLGAYAAGHGLSNAGVLAGDDMTPEAAFTKLAHLLAQPLALEDRQQLFLTSLVGER
ncbi:MULTISPECIES: asparaginase [Halomonadaceae]|uniref:Asparaginase n=1 Tax=Vreelandella glaciei TaxID=186761 RepID=A0A7Z0LWJ4_9GAMM|nr:MULTISPECIES: asparaginase [Halomonas]NYS79985.1 asparaginase [Halomonas glaciei]|tara:strand:+ start:754 stop:1830 length:1077 start_codon:yes stop_codon:yes gene_type:complete